MSNFHDKVATKLVQAKEKKDKTVKTYEEKLLAFCSKPRTSSEIIGLFPGRMAANIWSTIHSLLKERRLHLAANKYVTDIAEREINPVMTMSASKKTADDSRFKSDEDIAKEFEGVKILNIEIKDEWESTSQYSETPTTSTVVSGWIELEFPQAGESVGGGMEENEGPSNVTDQWIMYNKTEPDKIAFSNWYPEKIYNILRNAVKEKVLGKESSKRADKGQQWKGLAKGGNSPEKFNIDKKNGNPPSVWRFANQVRVANEIKINNLEKSIEHIKEQLKRSNLNDTSKEEYKNQLKKYKGMLEEAKKKAAFKIANDEENEMPAEEKTPETEDEVTEAPESDDVDIETIAQDSLTKWVDGETKLIELHKELHEVYGDTAEQIFEVIMDGIDEVVSGLKEELGMATEDGSEEPELDIDEFGMADNEEKEASKKNANLLKRIEEIEAKLQNNESWKDFKEELFAVNQVSNWEEMPDNEKEHAIDFGKELSSSQDKAAEVKIAAPPTRRRGSWIIMNASSWAGRTKMSVEDIIKLEDVSSDFTIMVAQKGDRFGDKWQNIFVLGASSNYGEPGTETTYTVDTGMGYGKSGDIKVENRIDVKGGEIVGKQNDIGLNERRSFWVFK